MIRPFRRVKKFTNRGQNNLLDALNSQLDSANAGIQLAQELVTAKVEPTDARHRMSEIEHEGDQARFDFIAVLRRVLTLPIDREDLFRVSRSIDDVLDTLRDFTRLYDMLSVKGKQPEMLELLEAIEDGTENLGIAVKAMMENPRNIRRAAIMAKKNRVRHLYQDALAGIINKQEVTADTLKKIELFHLLEEVALSLTEAADILSDGAIKRSH